VSNGLHSESPLQKCPQCNVQCKSPLPVLTGGPQDLARSSRYRRRRLKASVSFHREKADARRNRCVSFRRDSGDAGSRNVSLMLIHSNGLCFMPVTKVPCGPRETVISRDRWLVVVMVVVWCLLRILYVLRRVWNRRISVRQDSGDTGAHQASLILSFCNGLCFGAYYESSLWTQRNSHFTWLVASCGNGHCLMLIMNMSYQCPLLSWLICNTWSVTGALPVTKGDLRPFPKPVFQVVCCASPVKLVSD
jgi:hypothetical protein